MKGSKRQIIYLHSKSVCMHVHDDTVKNKSYKFNMIALEIVEALHKRVQWQF